MSQTNSLKMKTFIEQLEQVQLDLKLATTKGDLLKSKQDGKSKIIVKSIHN